MKKSFLSLLLVMPLYSCFNMFGDNYRGVVTTTLAGHITINEKNCYVASDIPSEDELALSLVINLETMGDKIVTLCITNDNIEYLIDYITTPPNDVAFAWILDGTNLKEIKIAFYASDVVAKPGGNSIGDASEILLFGTNQTNEYKIAEFNISSLLDNSCASHLDDESKHGTFLADLDLNVLHKKPYIVARIPFCGNYPIGKAANPLYSEKNLDN